MSKKIFYIYNPKTLTYERVYPSLRQRIIVVLRHLFVGSILSIGVIVAFYFWFGSPKEELLKMVQDIGNINIHFVRQKEPKGLGHAILCAKRFIGHEPFAVLLGDDVVYNDQYPCLKQLIDVYNATGGSVLGCQTVPQEKVSAYGIVDSIPTDNERIFKVKDMVEKPAVEDAPSRLAVLGRYVITPEIFRILDHTEPGKGGEIQLTDALKVLARQQDMYAYDFIGRRYDVGDKQGYLEAQVEYALRREDLAGKFREYLKTIV